MGQAKYVVECPWCHGVIRTSVAFTLIIYTCDICHNRYKIKRGSVEATVETVKAESFLSRFRK